MLLHQSFTYPQSRNIWKIHRSAFWKHISNGFPRARERVRPHDINVQIRVEAEVDPVRGPPDESRVMREAFSRATLWIGISSYTNLLRVSNLLRSVD